MSRLDELRRMRDFLDAEIATEIGPSCHEIIERAAGLYEVSLADVLGRGRVRRVIAARHGAAWLLMREGLSWRDIGDVLGLDHSTVGYAVRKIESAPSVRALLRGLDVHSASTDSVAAMAFVGRRTHSRIMPTEEPA